MSYQVGNSFFVAGSTGFASTAAQKVLLSRPQLPLVVLGQGTGIASVAIPFKSNQSYQYKNPRL